MNKNRVIEFAISFIIILIITIILIHRGTFGYNYENKNYTLFYKDNFAELKEDISKYLSEIDHFIIVNSSYIYSDILTENYDFLTNFSLDYIIDNKNIYLDKIKNFDEFEYYDKNHTNKKTNEYISIDEIYNITDKYFGISKYVIINDNVKIIDNNISLSDYTNSRFNKQITDVELLDKYEDKLVVLVTYDSTDKYKYTFINVNNVLKIYNVEV